jgi:hypothetical protein
VLTLVGAAWWQERARIASTGRSYAEYWEGREGEEGEGEADKAGGQGRALPPEQEAPCLCALGATQEGRQKEGPQLDGLSTPLVARADESLISRADERRRHRLRAGSVW